jgi:hypothetical protein
MKIQSIVIGDITASEIVSDEVMIRTAQDALDIMANCTSEYIILHEYNFEKDFFDLSSGIAGEILQKFTNYKVKLAIIGDFEKFTSKSLHDFIYESNKNGEYLFVHSIEDVIKVWERLTK